MTFKVIILGSNSAIPTNKRHPTAQVVNHNERFFLIDCAEGTQMQLRKFKIKIQRINHILISHLHGDHFFGLIGLISTMHLLGRKKELHVYGPHPLEEVIRLQLEVSQTELVFPFVFHVLDPAVNSIVYEDNRLTIETIPLDHRIPTCGFLFKEKLGKRRIRKEVVEPLAIQPEKLIMVKDGEDYTDAEGNVYPNQTITDDPYPVRSYAYCSDTRYSETILPLIRNVNLLYHEATFSHELADVAHEKFHSTAQEAATIAGKAQAGKLIIGHFSNRYDSLEELLAEAQRIFPNSEAALDGMEFEIVA